MKIFIDRLSNLLNLLLHLKKNPDAGKFSSYAEDKYGRGSGQFVSYFKDLPKDKIIQPYISQKDPTKSNVNAAGQKLMILDIN